MKPERVEGPESTVPPTQPTEQSEFDAAAELLPQILRRVGALEAQLAQPLPEQGTSKYDPELMALYASEAYKKATPLVKARMTREVLYSGKALGASRASEWHPDAQVELLKEALRIAGSPQRLAEWMQTPVPALNGQTPYAMMRTEEGRKQVESVLMRIDHGVF